MVFGARRFEEDDRAVSRLDRRLDELTDRLERLTGATAVGRAPALRASPSELSDIARRLDRLSATVDRPREDGDDLQDAIAEITRRQSVLSGRGREPARRAPSRDVGSSWEGRETRRPAARQDLARGEPARADGRTEAALERQMRALSAKIDALSDTRAAPSTAGVAEELKSIRRALEGTGRGDRELAEIRSLSAKLDELGRRLPETRGDEAVARALAELKETVLELNLAGSFRSLERGYGHIVERLDQLGRSIGPDPRLLDRVEDLREQLLAAPQAEQLAQIERRIAGLASKVDRLAEQPSGPAVPAVDPYQLADIEKQLIDLKGLVGRFDPTPARVDLDAIAGRIDDLARAAERNAGTDRLAALEARLVDLSSAIESFDRGPGGALLAAFERRIGDLGRKIDSLERGGPAPAAPVGDGGSLAESLRRIEELLSTRPAGDRFGALETRIDEIADRLERAAALPRGTTDVGGLAAEIARLRDEIAARAEPRRSTDLEAHLAALVDKLDQTARPGAGDAALAELQDQVERIVDHLQKVDRRFDQLGGGLETSLARLEEGIVESRDSIAQVAREAARDAVSGLALGAATDGADPSLINALQDDLKRLQIAARTSDSRTQDNFQAVRDTLEAIVQRLATIETPAPARAAPHAAPLAASVHAPPAPVAPPDAGAQRAVAAAAAAVAAPAAPAAETRSVEAAPYVEAPKPKTAVEKALSAIEDARPLEPGSGKPDPARVARAAEAAAQAMAQSALAAAPAAAPVRAAAATPASDVDPASRKAEFIAAARRAAQAAAAAAAEEPAPPKSLMDRLRPKRLAGDAPDVAPAAPPSVPVAERLAADLGLDEPKPAGRFGKLGGLATLPRKPVMMAAAALLLAILALQIVPRLVGGGEEAEAPRVETPAPVADVATPPQAPLAAAPDAQPVARLPAPSALAPPETPPPAIQPAAATPTPAVAPSSFQPATPPAAPAPAAVAPPVGELPAAIGPDALRRAAAGGDPKAMFEVGARYTDGRGVGADPKAAAGWYERAAAAGLAPAQYRLGSLYEKGQGVGRDLAMARLWYERAAEKGNVKAMHNLAVVLTRPEEGRQQPTPQALQQSIRWFQRAAEHGVRDSQFNLGIMFFKGYGTGVDAVQSYKWFAVAAKAGDGDAAKKRDEVARTMDKAALDRAVAEADRFKSLTADPAANDVPDTWGGAPATTGSVDPAQMTPTRMREIQMRLASLGLFAGTVDGEMNARTREAVTAFQKRAKLEPTGRLDAPTLEALTGARR